MIEYKYQKVKGHDQKKFLENGHTMFETDVLRRLQRLAGLEEQIKQGKLLPIKVFNFDCWDKSGAMTAIEIEATCKEHAILKFDKKYDGQYGYDDPY